MTSESFCSKQIIKWGIPKNLEKNGVKEWFYMLFDSKTNPSTINCLSSDLTEVSRNDIGNLDNVICTNGTVIIRMSQFNGDTTAFKNWLSSNNITLYYWLATPIETDISQYIDDDSIQIVANGIITFNNTYQQAVPYEYLYLEKVGANNE